MKLFEQSLVLGTIYSIGHVKNFYLKKRQMGNQAMDD